MWSMARPRAADAQPSDGRTRRERSTVRIPRTLLSSASEDGGITLTGRRRPPCMWFGREVVERVGDAVSCRDVAWVQGARPAVKAQRLDGIRHEQTVRERDCKHPAAWSGSGRLDDRSALLASTIEEFRVLGRIGIGRESLEDPSSRRSRARPYRSGQGSSQRPHTRRCGGPSTSRTPRVGSSRVSCRSWRP